MKVKVHKFEAAYRSSLQECLVGAGEVALQHGYELGRQAVQDGLGLEDVVTVHREVLLSLLSGAATAEACRHIVKAEQDLFGECLAPFELTHGGFLEVESLNRKLEAANRELESFSYSVSHDLRAPLRAIDGYSRMLMKKYGGTLDEGPVQLLNVIRSNTERMGVLIDELLSLSRVQKAGMTISEIAMDKLIGEVWNEIQTANKERALEFKITKILPGSGDRVLIRQVLFNLFSNAVKFTKKRTPGIIEIGSYNDSGKVVYSLRDNGAGFDMAYYAKLFGVFQRLHDPEEYEGTGVGLAIVQRIINRHGGDVWAEGEVDKGATFYFTLPISGSVPP